MSDLPALQSQFLPPPQIEQLEPGRRASHPPRILLLYGSLRERSYSRLATEEAAPAPGVRVRELRASFAGALRACVELPTAQVRRARTTRDFGWFPRETNAAGRRARDARDESDDGRERDE